MHLLLTDILTCPRCGPDHGLILLAHDLRDRRVHEGWLGCAHCRARWVVHQGFGEFRTPLDEPQADTAGADPAAAAAVVPAAEDASPDADGVQAGTATPSPDEAVRIAALLGVTEGPAFVLVAGPSAASAADVAALVPDLEVVAIGAPGTGSVPGVSRMAVADALPFYGGKLRGVWLAGEAADALLEEGARVVGPLGRLVLEPAPADAEARLAALGLKVLARQQETLVAARTA